CYEHRSRYPTPSLFPYTTLFRSRLQLVLDQQVAWRERERTREIGERAGGVVLVVEAQLRRFLEQGELGAIVVRLGEAGRQQVERSEEHTSELQSRENLVCRLLLE